jgi:Xaa-Pro aminopeptidase
MMRKRPLLLLTGLTLLCSLVVAAQEGVDFRLWNITRELKEIAPADRLAELADRRTRVARQIGDRGVAVLFAAEPRVYTGDQDYPLRQENNLYYLTGIKQAGVVLVLVPGAATTREILFVPRRDAWRETWTGRMLSTEEASARSGVKTVWDAALLSSFINTIAPRSTAGHRRPVAGNAGE